MIGFIPIVLSVLDSPSDLERRGFVDPDWVTKITVDLINRRARAHIRRSRHPLSSLISDGTDHPVSDGTVETGPLVGRVCVLAAGRPASNSEVPEVVEDDWIKAGFSLSNDEECLDHHRRRDDVGICCGTPPVFVSLTAAGSLMTRRLFIRTPLPSPVTAPSENHHIPITQ